MSAFPASASSPAVPSVNVNTARAVYGRLEDDGLIVSRQGLGTFVADDAPAFPELERLAADAAESARASGVDPRDLARAIYAGSAAALGNPDPRSPADRREVDLDRGAGELPAIEGDERLGRNELRRQIARLEAQLASYPDARKSGRADPSAAEAQGAHRRHGRAGGNSRRADQASDAGPRGTRSATVSAKERLAPGSRE